MIFKGWRKTSLIEYPGKIATVVFTGGCNFRCPFCHNADLVLRPETFPDITEAEVLSFLADNSHLYEALVVTGGEPTLQPDLPEFLLAVKSLGLNTGLETNGTHPRLLENLIAAERIDYIAMDIKASFSVDRYAKAAGCREPGLLARISESLGILKRSSVATEIRITVVPGLVDESDISALAHQLEGTSTLILQQFIPDHALDETTRLTKPYPVEQLERWKNLLSSHVECCLLRSE